MTPLTTLSWTEANQRYLTATLAEVRFFIDHHSGQEKDLSRMDKQESAIKQELVMASTAMPSPPALDTLCNALNLSAFERRILLLCAGIELDGSFAAACAEAQNDPRRPFPTFSLALATLPDAHWSALTPAAPLRYWQLIEIGSGGALTTSALKIDEGILHYLAGISEIDERLMSLMEPQINRGCLVPSHKRLAEKIVKTWSRSSTQTAGPVIQLCGREISDRQNIAAAACAELGLKLHTILSSSLPNAPGETETLLRLFEREAALRSGAIMLECCDAVVDDLMKPGFLAFIERMNGPLIISARERLGRLQCQILIIDIPKPQKDEQRALWVDALGEAAKAAGKSIDMILSQFDMSAEAIHEVSTIILTNIESPDTIGGALWESCRKHARARLDNLAMRIKSSAGWDDLVLPPEQTRILREITLHMRERTRVYETWGFASKSLRGLGISALFEGASGTGKTMAAEVLANEFHLDLYRIDLSAVVSKYIGETEKNLSAIFDAAENAGAILLFDEADALFGKRSEIRDSHDRYANIEVSYLLQRMESYRGLAILTTNMKSSLDTAFLRRIRFIVQFPFPDTAYRAEIWKRIFPVELPLDGIDYSKLARLTVAGGNIRNIALNAAFLAAGENGRVAMHHLLAAARGEYVKLEKPLSVAEIHGWV
jgi:hypothetical protein